MEKDSNKTKPGVHVSNPNGFGYFLPPGVIHSLSRLLSFTNNQRCSLNPLVKESFQTNSISCSRFERLPVFSKHCTKSHMDQIDSR